MKRHARSARVLRPGSTHDTPARDCGGDPRSDAAGALTARLPVGVAIRNAQRDDLPALLSLYRELNPDDPPLGHGAAEAVWERIRSQAGRTVLVADIGSQLVGTIDCLVLPNLTRGARCIMFIENVVVAGAHRRQGIGALLLDHALRLARSADCYKAQLLSAAGPPAHAFYAAQRFTASARGYRRYL